MAARTLEFGDSIREKLLAGMDKLAQAVSVTLGPEGRTVILEKNFGEFPITKDGVTVAKHVFLRDPYENQGAQILKQAATKTAQVAGDGTTTATVIGHRLARLGFAAMQKGANPVHLKRGIELAAGQVIQYIRSISQPLNTATEIVQVATVSANWEIEIGRLIGEAIAKIGREGVLTVEASNLFATTLEYKEGMSFDQGFIDDKFITNSKTNSTELEDCAVLIYDGVISSLNSILPFVTKYHDATNINGVAKHLLIIAQDIKNEALSAFLVNLYNGRLKNCAVRAPFTGAQQNDLLDDLALVTGATVISPDKGDSWAKAELEMLGTAEKVKITRHNTTIIGGGGDKEAIKARCEEVRLIIRDAIGDTEKMAARSRLAKLHNGIGVIKAGGATNVEMQERRDRIEDAIHATHAALEDGICPGGGTVLAKISNLTAITPPKGASADELIGVTLLLESLKEPLSKILSNAALDVEAILKEFNDGAHKDKFNFGVDARSGKVVDMITSGIIDPTKVIITTLQNAVSIAGTILTTECGIVYDPTDPDKDGI
jgi:chaperonin GroEL